MVTDLIGHGGYVALVLGQLLVTRRSGFGFLLRVVGSLVWAGIGWWIGMTSILVWSLLFAGVDLWGWRAWRRDGA